MYHYTNKTYIKQPDLQKKTTKSDRQKTHYLATNTSKFNVPRSAPFTISVIEWAPG